MKRITASTLLLATVFGAFSCFDPGVDSSDAALRSVAGARDDAPVRNCATMDVLAEDIKNNPGQAKKYDDVEKHTKQYVDKLATMGTQATAATSQTLTIPVAIHVLYYTAQENISLAQIQSQIDVLNKDYSNSNADRTKLPSAFSSLPASMDIKFTLNTADIERKQSNKQSWGTRDAMKSSKKGGFDPKDPSKYLNIWICNIGGGILGYAQFPGGQAATDGVVIGPQYFGNTGYVAAPYDKGRTATHEIGHWLNLRHIWGDASCGNDQVADTPTQQTANYGCPSFPHVTCSNGPNGDLFMNYMDYTDDACMYMFTNGQKARSQAIFAPGGARQSFVTTL
jgi:hypothetical protein